VAKDGLAGVRFAPLLGTFMAAPAFEPAGIGAPGGDLLDGGVARIIVDDEYMEIRIILREQRIKTLDDVLPPIPVHQHHGDGGMALFGSIGGHGIGVHQRYWRGLIIPEGRAEGHALFTSRVTSIDMTVQYCTGSLTVLCIAGSRTCRADLANKSQSESTPPMRAKLAVRVLSGA
jgi:hypothetical protein